MVRLSVALGMALVFGRLPAVLGDEVPTALDVEWQGQKLCEKLFEDPQIRVARCVFPPGAVHLRHSHPGYFSYVLSGGNVQIEDDKGKRSVAVSADSVINSPPVPWHEVTNSGDTTVRYLVVERKYETVGGAEQTTGK